MNCDGCTLCCKLLETHGVPSPIGTYCKECTPGVGCGIYEDRPEECRTYYCMWAQMEIAAPELRPDKCGIIFDRIADDLITSRLDETRKLDGLIGAQIECFHNEGFNVVVFHGAKKMHKLQPGRTIAYVEEVINGRA